MDATNNFLSGDPHGKLLPILFWAPLIFTPISMWVALRVWSSPDESILGHCLSIILLSISGFLIAFFCMYFFSDYEWPNGSSVLDMPGLIGWAAFTLSLMGILYSVLFFLFSDTNFLASDTVSLNKVSSNSFETVFILGFIFWNMKVFFDVSFLRCKKRKLFEAIWVGDNRTLREILDKRPYLANSFSSIGISPLYEAIVYGHPKLVLLLVEYGARVDSGTTLGRTPLHLAATKGWNEMALFLLSHDAYVNPIDVCGRTPLDEVDSLNNYSRSDRSKYADMLNILLEHGGKSAVELQREKISR